MRWIHLATTWMDPSTAAWLPEGLQQEHRLQLKTALS
jgi:hypothetical protein